MTTERTIAQAMSFLIDSNRAEVRGIAFDPRAPQDDPKARLGFAFRVYKGPGSIGWYNEDFGGEDYTVLNVYLDIAKDRLYVSGPADVRRRSCQTVLALVVLKPEARVSVDELLAWCRASMAVYKAPRQVQFVESLPKSGSGKVMWRALQEAESASQTESATANV